MKTGPRLSGECTPNPATRRKYESGQNLPLGSRPYLLPARFGRQAVGCAALPNRVGFPEVSLGLGDRTGYGSRRHVTEREEAAKPMNHSTAIEIAVSSTTSHSPSHRAQASRDGHLVSVERKRHSCLLRARDGERATTAVSPEGSHTPLPPTSVKGQESIQAGSWSLPSPECLGAALDPGFTQVVLQRGTQPDLIEEFVARRLPRFLEAVRPRLRRRQRRVKLGGTRLLRIRQGVDQSQGGLRDGGNPLGNCMLQASPLGTR